MPRLNYFAIVCENSDKLRDFYGRWFGFEELRRDPAGGVYLTDGYFTVGLLPLGSTLADGAPLGLQHVGIQIESIDEVAKRLREFDPTAEIEELPRGGSAEYRVTDPAGLIIDLSEEGWGAGDQPRVPSIRHIATCNPQEPWRSFEFYREVFGMRDARLTAEEQAAHMGMWERRGNTEVVRGVDASGLVTRMQWDPVARSIVEVTLVREPRPSGPHFAFACDGFVNLALLQSSDWIRPNLNHFGILVRDSYGLLQRITEETGLRLDQRPQDRPFAEYRVWDPEGNAIDLSERKGYKVDTGTIVRVEEPE